MTSALPFDDFRALLRDLPEANGFAGGRVRERIGQLGHPAEGLGAIAGMAEWLATWSSKPPAVNRPLVALFAGNHGVVGQGVTALPMSATAAIVEHCAAGGAAVSQVCGANDLGLKVFDLALDVPTEDFSRDAALDERGCAATMAFGMEAVAGGFDLIALGAIGVGGDFVASAVFTALWGGSASDWIVESDPLRAGQQAGIVEAALAFHGAGNLRDPFEVLRRVGGREIAAIAGAIIAARTERIPVLLDGYAALSAAALLASVNPEAISHCRVASSLEGDVANRAVARLGLQPLLDLRISQPGVGGGMAAIAAKTAAQVFSGLRPLPSLS